MSARPDTQISSQKLRGMMPVAMNYAYFDHAAVAPLPRPAAQAVTHYAEQAQNHGDALWPSWASRVESLRSKVARLLSCKQAEIALVHNTTQGINLVAQAMPWRQGDNLVVPDNEFPSNMLPWKGLERHGVEVRVVPVPASGTITADVLTQFVDSKTRLIAISWIGFASGFRVDVAKIVELGHSRGALVLLDAIQGVGAFPLNVERTGVDFVCADGHKWMLGPEGAGVFYLHREHLNLLQPVGLGWNSLAAGAFDPRSSELKPTAARFEGGTTNMAGMHGLEASLSVLFEAGLNEPDMPLSAAILQNVGSIEEELNRVGLQTLLPREAVHRSGIVGVTWPEATENPVLLSLARKYLLERNIVTSVRGGRLRVSTHAYNDVDDIQRLVTGLAEFRKREFDKL